MLAICRAGSFMGAARDLKSSQGNVSKVIAAMEKDLGKQLFIRKSNGVELTADGEYVRVYAEEIERLTDALQTFVQTHARVGKRSDPAVLMSWKDKTA